MRRSFGTRQDGAPPLRNRKFALLWREIDSNHRFLATASLIVSACRLVCCGARGPAGRRVSSGCDLGSQPIPSKGLSLRSEAADGYALRGSTTLSMGNSVCCASNACHSLPRRVPCGEASRRAGLRKSGPSGSMSGDGKRGDGHRPPATAPIFDSTVRDMTPAATGGAVIKGGADILARGPFMLRPRCPTRGALSCRDPEQGSFCVSPHRA